MADACNTKLVLMRVQENGIIRRESDGYLVAILDKDIDYDSLEEFEGGTVIIKKEEDNGEADIHIESGN